MDEKKAKILTDKREILARLRLISDASIMMRHFYPLLTAHAGEEKSAHELIEMVHEEIENFTKHQRNMISTKMHLDMFKFVEALIDDQDVLREVAVIFDPTKPPRKKRQSATKTKKAAPADGAKKRRL